MIYGITGTKGHGKDTLAKLIQKHNPDYRVLHFAGKLKNICREVYGLTDPQLTELEHKEKLFDQPLNMDEYVVQLSEATGLSILSRGLIAKNAREVMQFVGTEYVRSIQDSYWRDCVERELTGNCLVPDTRFINEAELIRRHGGKIIRVERMDLPKNTDGHASETEQLMIQVDLTIRVKTGDFDALEKVARVLACDPDGVFKR